MFKNNKVCYKLIFITFLYLSATEFYYWDQNLFDVSYVFSNMIPYFYFTYISHLC